MPLYMDRHEVPGATPEALAAAHEQDLNVQLNHGVRYLTYWFEEETGHVFCLAEGPSAQAVEDVHREAHGLLATSIIEVQPGSLNGFFGKIPEHPPGEAYVDSAVRAVLFTDICDSTAMTQKLGDLASMELVREHDVLVRAALGAHKGNEVKHTGDGIMASFPSVSAAVEAAIAVQVELAKRNATAENKLEVRIGISAGEPVTEAADLFGAAVQLAARLCSTCEPGGISVSVAVRELCIGKGLRFDDGGTVELKGFAEPTQIYAVNFD